MPIFEADTTPGVWLPSPLAAGPFAGLQGGAIASLLTAEVEAQSIERGCGTAISVFVSFLKPTPMAKLRTQISPLRTDGRVCVIDNTMFSDGDDEPCATARVTLVKERGVEAPDIPEHAQELVNPLDFPERRTPSFHGKPWMMDAMETRMGGGIAWFRQTVPIVAGAQAGALSSILGPADWAHGIGRPLQNVVADPNPNLSVHQLRKPENGWIGVHAHAGWDTARGVGIGGGTLLDVRGEIGRVSMAVALVPFPKPKAEKV
jgi:hypothetical protein